MDIAITDEIIVVAAAIVYSLLLLLVVVLVVPVAVVVDVFPSMGGRVGNVSSVGVASVGEFTTGELTTGEGVGVLLEVPVVLGSIVLGSIPQYFWQMALGLVASLAKSTEQSPPNASPEGHPIPQVIAEIPYETNN